mmetsp:Transcript_7089/g.16103  ORF Transcript_7089/g.16103 Transcript_7089/m.16103 type:complete len:600 (+) Transcript_7089:63-1862(+)
MMNSIASLGWCCIALQLLCLGSVDGFSAITSSKIKLKHASLNTDTDDEPNNTYTFSIPLTNKRPKPSSFIETFKELWNDPRPVSSLIATNDRSAVGERENDAGAIEEIPYCIISDEFDIEGELFQILLYPRGRFVGDPNANSNDDITGSASAYLRYLPKKYGDETDIAWKLRLVSKPNEDDKTALSISTAGGLPRSNTTWSAAMTFCTELESVESVGRTTDWGSSIWTAQEVCNALGNLYAEGEITVFGRRGGESSFGFPILQKGAVGAVNRAANPATAQNVQRDYRVGEVIVPRNIPGLGADIEALKEQFVYPGLDYRVMTMSDKDGSPIFSTDSISADEKGQARLALRPCGWKLQQQLWKRNGMKTDWPVEVNAGLLSKVTTTRFNPESAIPRVVSAFQRDWISYSLALAVALTPIPLTLVARNFVSLYDIPSASMEPTLLKGDVLLVEKFPGVYQRTKRGDVVLFQPPPALRDIVTNSGSQLPSTSLFVKRIVGLPGDRNIRLVDDNNVMINGINAVGPDRHQCTDEPLRLIDKLLENGKGTRIDQLGDDEAYVLGDCNAVSVDSRVFGTLPKDNIVGKPVARIWPLNRIKLSGPF